MLDFKATHRFDGKLFEIKYLCGMRYIRKEHGRWGAIYEQSYNLGYDEAWFWYNKNKVQLSKLEEL